MLVTISITAQVYCVFFVAFINSSLLTHQRIRTACTQYGSQCVTHNLKDNSYCLIHNQFFILFFNVSRIIVFLLSHRNHRNHRNIFFSLMIVYCLAEIAEIAEILIRVIRAIRVRKNFSAFCAFCVLKIILSVCYNFRDFRAFSASRVWRCNPCDRK